MKKYTIVITPMLTAIVLALIGIAFIVFPLGTVGTVLRIIGAILLAVEIARLIPLIKRSADVSSLLLFLLSDIFVIVFAIILLINPIGALRTLSIILGVYFLISAAVELYRLSQRRIAGVPQYIMPVLSLLFGVFLILYPTDATQLSLIIIGVTLLFKAADVIISEIVGGRTARKKSAAKGTVVTTKYKDVTNKSK